LIEEISPSGKTGRKTSLNGIIVILLYLQTVLIKIDFEIAERKNKPPKTNLRLIYALQGEEEERTCFSKGVNVDHTFDGIKRVPGS